MKQRLVGEARAIIGDDQFGIMLLHFLVVRDRVVAKGKGDQKDEVPWSATLQLVATLTDRRIGQLWLDHTGHNSDRQYGSSTISASHSRS